MSEKEMINLGRAYLTDLTGNEYLEKDGSVHYKYQYMDSFEIGCSLEKVPVELREKMQFYSHKMKLWLEGFMMDIVKELEE